MIPKYQKLINLILRGSPPPYDVALRVETYRVHSPSFQGLLIKKIDLYLSWLGCKE